MNQPPQNKLFGAPVLHPEPHPARFVEPARPVLPRVVPTLTVYADGNVNLNGEASALLSGLSDGACLTRPEKVRAGRQEGPWLVSARGCEKFRGRADKPGQLRFWADRACLPTPGRYLLAATCQPDQFSLIPA